jgi:hypothetical protein
MKKVLLFLDASNPVNRVIRRGVVAGLCVFVAVGITAFLPQAPVWAVPMLTAILMGAEKYIRDILEI